MNPSLAWVSAAGLSASVLVCGAAMAQPKNNIGEPLAKILLGNGCRMSVSDALKAEGNDTSDFNAQYKALGKGNYINLEPDGKTIKLVNWGSCK